MSVNGTSTMPEQNVVPEKRFSRVSRLRDMFQNGVVRPIEEIDNFEAYVSPPPFSHTEDPTRFLRSLPGSPPLSALRNHRSIIAKEGIDNPNPAKYKPGAVISHVNGNGTVATGPCTVPPARPPKPRHLVLDKVSPSKSPPAPVKTKISSELKKSIALFENGSRDSVPNGVDNTGSMRPLNICIPRSRHLSAVVRQSPTLSIPNVTLRESNGPISATPTTVHDAQNQSTVRLREIEAVQPPAYSASQPVGEQTSTTDVLLAQPSWPTRSDSGPTPPAPSHPDQTQDTTSPSCPAVATANESGTKSEHELDCLRDLEVSSAQPRLSSWQATTALDRIETSTGESSVLQDFILQSDAFRVSPQFLSSSHIEDNLPTLQHAEPIAVASPDEDDESDAEHTGLMYTVEDTGVVAVRPVAEPDASVPAEPTLPVPPGLKVVAVDFQGVHILEDGNFFYAVPGLSSRPDSPEDSDFLSTRPHHPFMVAGGDSAEDHETTTFSELSGLSDSVQPGPDLSLQDTSTDSGRRQPRVRFSTEPIVIYSTHSTQEYNRRNDDIDPLAASAEYELEKHLEEMEMHNVDLKKGPQGLGISILGLGVDNVGGDQKLGIFIKALTPGGAAEADGRIQVFDQIVAVDGQSLVGVSQKFAAHTLRNTRDVVHFILARERDPANSRVAQLLAEQQEEERMMLNAVLNRSDTNSEETKQPISMSRDDSVETLHRLMADAAETAARAMAETWSDNDEDDDDDVEDEDEEENELVIDEESPFNPGNTVNNERVVDLSSMSVASSVTDGNANPGLASPRSALKGTATAASTKRRQDAIAQLIQAAASRSKSSNSPSEDHSLPAALPTAATTPNSASADGITWLLASDLYDCHNQLTKLQSQMRVLEQRLTAQEAAADEAIERLCLQCRHVELELNEARQRLQVYLQTQQNGEAGGSGDGLPNGTGGTNSQHTNNHITASNGSVNSPACSTPSSAPAPTTLDSMQASVNPVSASLSIWSSQDLGTELANLAVQALDPTRPGFTYEDGWITGPSEPSFDSMLYSPEPYMKNGTGLPRLDTSPTQPDGQCGSPARSPQDDQANWFHGAHERVRLITSGGLARRRPPTRIVVQPPLILPPGVELSMVCSSDDSPSNYPNGNNGCTTPPQATTKPARASPSAPELLVRSGASAAHAATPTAEPPPVDLRTGSMVKSDQMLVEAQPLLTLSSSDNGTVAVAAACDGASPASDSFPSSSSSTLAKHKKLGIELPGLSAANHVVLRHRERPNSSVATTTTSGLSAAEVRRQANTALLSSLKGVPQSP